MKRLIVSGLVGLSAACGSSTTGVSSTGASAGMSTAGSNAATGTQGTNPPTSGTATSGSAVSGSLGGSGAASAGATSGTAVVTSGAATGSGANSSGSMTPPTDGGGTTGQDAMTTVQPPVEAGVYPGDGGGPCPANAIFCDGFEEYPTLAPFDAMGNLRDFIPTGSTTPTC